MGREWKETSRPPLILTGAISMRRDFFDVSDFGSMEKFPTVSLATTMLTTGREMTIPDRSISPEMALPGP